MLLKNTQNVILGKLPVNFYPVKINGKKKPYVLPCLLLIWMWQFLKRGMIHNSSSVREKQTNETDEKSFFSET